MALDVGALAGAAQQNAAVKKTELTGNFDMFLRLLTTQLKNQDPLQPMDSSEFTNQLVMYSQVEQQIKSNEQLASLVSLQGNLQLQSALTYVGMDVRYQGDIFNYAGSGDYTFDYALPSDAKTTKINILNEAGEIVFTANGELTGKKLHTFKWDGKTSEGLVAPAGEYTIKVGANDAEGKPLEADIAVWGQVTGMETTVEGEILLNLNKIPVSLTNILAARQHQQPVINN